MTLETGEHVFGVSDAQIAVVTSNTLTKYELGPRMSIPGLNTIEIAVSSEKKECKAGLTTVATKRKKTGYSVKFSNVEINLDIIAAINGATLVKSGASQNQINELVESGDDIPVIFNLAYKCDDIDGAPADLHYEYYAVSGLMDISSKTDDYASCSFEGDAVVRKMPLAINEKKISNVFRKITEHEAETAISST